MDQNHMVGLWTAEALRRHRGTTQESIPTAATYQNLKLVKSICQRTFLSMKTTRQTAVDRKAIQKW